jgi:hypothetical protein
MGKVEVGLTFDGGSNCTIVTKEYAKRWKLRKIAATSRSLTLAALRL